MKKIVMSIGLVACMSLAMVSCQEKTPSEKAADNIEDAADEVGDGMEDAADEVGDGMEEAGENIEEGAEEVKEDAQDAVN